MRNIAAPVSQVSAAQPEQLSEFGIIQPNVSDVRGRKRLLTRARPWTQLPPLGAQRNLSSQVRQ